MNAARRYFEFAARGRPQALLAALLAALLSWVLVGPGLVFPPLLFVAMLAYFASPAVIILTALRQGVGEALLVGVGPALLWLTPVLISPSPADLAVFPVPAATVQAIAWMPFMLSVVMTLVPATLAAWVLRLCQSQGAAIVAAVAALAVLLTGMLAMGVEPLSWVLGHGREVMNAMITAAKEQGPDSAAASLALVPVLGETRAVSGAETGVLMGMVLVSVTLALLLGRWAHALLDNPGGFGIEFRALRIDWRLAAVAAALGGVSMLGGGFGHWAQALCVLALSAFVFQAIAVVHAIVRKRKAGRGWLTGMYVLLVLPFTSGLAGTAAAVAGIVDAWVDFRARAGATD